MKIILAMKPVEKSFTENITQHDVGGINIDKCRIGNEKRFNRPAVPAKDDFLRDNFNHSNNSQYEGEYVSGRFPSNILGDCFSDYLKTFFKTIN